MANVGERRRTRGGTSVGWRIWADDAEVVEGRQELRQFSALRRAMATLQGPNEDSSDK